MDSIIGFVRASWPNIKTQILRRAIGRMVKEGELIKKKWLYKIGKKSEKEAIEEDINAFRKVPPKNIIPKLRKKKPGRKPSKYVQSDPEIIVIKEEPQEPVKEVIKPKRQYKRKVQSKIPTRRKLRSTTRSATLHK